MTTTSGRSSVSDGDDLLHSLREAQDQLHATGEMLRTLGRSASDLDAVMRTVTESARRLSRGDAAAVYLFDGREFRLAWSSGVSEAFLAFVRDHPVRADRSALVGRVGRDRETQQIADVLADPEYSRTDLQRLGHYRTVIGAPMLVDDEVVGVLNLWRNTVSPFSDREVELLTSYAAQAAIAVRTARLMRDLEAHREALTRRLDQLEALSAVGESVSSSLDPDEVLTTIVHHAVALAGADGGSILEFDPESERFRVRTTFGTDPQLVEDLRALRVELHGSLVGRAALEGRPLQVADLAEEAPDPHLRLLRDGGWRSVVTVPMLRQGRVAGALVIRRREPGLVDDETCELLETFASQSSLALANAHLYRRLERQSEELAVASRHKSEFLASMSHELRTPLNAIIGFSEVLLERMFGDLNERQAEYLGDIHDSGKHLLALLNDILDLSKVEAGHMELDLRPVDLPTLVASTVGLVRERAARGGLALVVDVPDSLPLVEVDELRARQVLLNLLTNAVKFTPSGGTVTVRAEGRGDEVEIAVEDTGVGIAPQDRERIFESFQQGGHATTGQEGTGLGLTLSRRIVDLHRGRLWVDSEEGRGSSFRFTVPVHRASVDEAGTDTSGGAVVLLVEDDRRSADLMRILLADQGFRVVHAASGEEALAVVARELPAAVVLDIRLPGISGWEVLARVKRDPASADVPVIVVSILDERGRGYALGADDYLVKPVARELLVQSLRRAGLVPGPDPRRVWVVDRDAVTRGALVDQLESGGWHVQASATVADGLPAARAAVPDAVLVDLVSVSDDGFAAVRALHEDDALRDVPVVALAPDGADPATWTHLADEVTVAASAAPAGAADLLLLLDRVTTAGTGGGRT